MPKSRNRKDHKKKVQAWKERSIATFKKEIQLLQMLEAEAKKEHVEKSQDTNTKV